MKIAIVGAGMAGLSCADALAAAGHEVALFDKGRGPGGRMSTRRADTLLGEVSFDHGAQFFTARSPEFQHAVEHWASAGVVSAWPEISADAYVGVPAMNAVVKHMASLLSVEFGFLVQAIHRDGERWTIVSKQDARTGFDALVVALPAEQAAPMLSLHDFGMARLALNARSEPCWTAMFAFASAVPFAEHCIKNLGAIGWAACNSSKPGRGSLQTWVVQANAAWSAKHLEDTADAVAYALQQELKDAIGSPLPEIIYRTAHRWRFALSSGTTLGSLWSKDLRLGVCGDWLLGSRVECAWLFGQSLAADIINVPIAPHVPRYGTLG